MSRRKNKCVFSIILNPKELPVTEEFLVLSINSAHMLEKSFGVLMVANWEFNV